MDKDNKSFEYTYSATKQDELERIRKKYIPKELLLEFNEYIFFYFFFKNISSFSNWY